MTKVLVLTDKEAGSVQAAIWGYAENEGAEDSCADSALAKIKRQRNALTSEEIAKALRVLAGQMMPLQAAERKRG